MRETKISKMPKLSLVLQVSSLTNNFPFEKKNSSFNRMKTVTSERSKTHTPYHSMKAIIPEILNDI